MQDSSPEKTHSPKYDKPLIDLDFGLSQLGGNETLLKRMFGKFKDEFCNASEQITKLIDAGEYEDAKMRVHTAKGITGNLGLMALFVVCKTLDTELKDKVVSQQTVHRFTEVLNATCEAIDEQTASVSTPTNETKHIVDAHQQLNELLKRNEFIDDALLQDLVSSLALADDDKTRLVELIESLQYDEAIKLVNQV